MKYLNVIHLINELIDEFHVKTKIKNKLERRNCLCVYLTSAFNAI